MPERRLKRLIDPNTPGSLSYRARSRRWEEFARRFPDLATMKVLDLGGTVAFWELAPVQPDHVTVVNLRPGSTPSTATATSVEVVTGDACAGGFGQFDLVVSNSLIEHVGGHAQRRRLADVIASSAPRHWVQTPYRYFPIEPHWVFPGFQWLPFRARLAVARHWRLGHMQPSTDWEAAVDDVAWVELLSITEMRRYFPGSDLWLERVAGVPKSMVAVGGGECPGVAGA